MKKSAVVMFAAALLLFAGGTLRAQGYLHASGIYLADGNNNQIILRGMGLGGWLVPEGYMLGVNAPGDSPTGFEEKVLGVVSTAAKKNEFFQSYRQYYVQKKDIDSLAFWGYNSVRLPMFYKLLTTGQGQFVESGFATIDSLLAWCEADRIYLILDLHCAPGGQNTGNISDYQGAPSLWENQGYRDWTVNLWKEIARRYANKAWIGGYDLLNETNFTLPNNNAALWALLKTITDSIRAVDGNHLVFWEGNNYATNFAGAPMNGLDGNMAWSFHKYWSANTDPGSISGYLSLRGNSNRPLWMGESGENSNQWFADAVTLFEKYKIGWSWWTLKKINSISCPLSARRAANFQTLENYWNNGGTKPSTAFAEAALMEQAALFDAGACVLHPDFNDALFRMPKTDARLPYADNVIPGVIFPVNYDMGKQGIAYYDTDYENDGNGVYNQGWSYRNDGVDIEGCSDPLSNGFDVGFTAAGEWMAYTVRVTQGGTYNIKLRHAASGTGATVSLDLDGAPMIAAVGLPTTGGWQTWRTIDLGNVSIGAGTRNLVLRVVGGGSNFNRLEFTLIGTGINGGPSPLKYGLDQNFPNPFNPSTDISFTARGSARATLKIYSILGEEIAVPFDGPAEAGRTYRVRFDASRLASGTYVYALQEGSVRESKAMLLIR